MLVFYCLVFPPYQIDAIKKIILESELGKFAKAGAVQNRKLRREVTTISRMTHKNIVRYYQAWVEGGIDGTVQKPGVIEEEENEEEEVDPINKVDAGEVLASEDDDDDGESYSDDNDGTGGGWWANNSPKDHDLPLQMKEATKSSSSNSGKNDLGDDESSTSWSDSEGLGQDQAGGGIGTGSYKRNSSALSNFPEDENDHIFGVSCHRIVSLFSERLQS